MLGFLFSLLIGMGLLAPSFSYGQDLIIYPAKGQSNEQIEKDKAECYKWAKSQTGFDPMNAPTASTPPPQQTEPQSNAMRGAVRGAILGTAIGAITGNVGKGAAVGAASGGILGAMKKRDQQAEQQNAQQQWAKKEASRYQQQRANYMKAYSACLEGRGYTVK